ncbi:hypothetical protein LMxysn_0454 [Listeria monocytogenes]|nr:hypothetical protein LMxysn_0454 [Listeria monocytogenes]
MYKEYKFDYIAVPEMQKRGAYHFHILLFGLPYIHTSKYAKIWKNGFVKINKVEQRSAQI